MNNILTSFNRLLNLPINYSDLQKDEEIVATSAEFGMLFVKDNILYEWDINETDNEYEKNINDRIPICLPTIKDYKKMMVDELTSKIISLSDIHIE